MPAAVSGGSGASARAGRENPGTAQGGGTDESRRGSDVGARFPGQALQEGGARSTGAGPTAPE